MSCSTDLKKLKSQQTCVKPQALLKQPLEIGFRGCLLGVSQISIVRAFRNVPSYNVCPVLPAKLRRRSLSRLSATVLTICFWGINSSVLHDETQLAVEQKAQGLIDELLKEGSV